MSAEGDLARAGIIAGDTLMTFTKDAEFVGDMALDGDLTVGENLTVAGDLFVGGNLTGTLLGSIYTLVIETFDVSAAASVYTMVPSDGAGRISAIRWVVTTALTTANSVLTIKINGGTACSQTVTVPYSGSAAGDTGEQLVSASATNAVVDAGDYIEIASDGGAATGIVTVLIEITRL